MSKIIGGIVKDLKSLPEKLKAKTGNVDKKKPLLMNPMCLPDISAIKLRGCGGYRRGRMLPQR